MKKSLVYTKTGDTGTTSLVGGTRVPKTHIRLEAYGTVDELSSYIGLLITYIKDTDDQHFLTSIQNKLFVVNACLATDTEKAQVQPYNITSEDVNEVEQEIDHIDEELPPLKAFVLSGGCREAALSHVCRTVCRRAERRILSLSEHYPVAKELTSYINRLSDYFFVLARKNNISNNKEEIFWKNCCK